MSDVAIRTLLRPLEPFLHDPVVTEISVNKPREVWLAKQGQPYMSCAPLPSLQLSDLETLAKLVAQFSDQEVTAERPLLSGRIPGGYRVQVVLPPAVPQGSIGISIRKPAMLDVDLDWYESRNAFAYVNIRPAEEEEAEKRLIAAYQERRFKDFFVEAVRARKNIVISAGTDTGKTTFLNAALKAIDHQERLITIEDTREVMTHGEPAHKNALHLLASRGQQGRSSATPQDLLEACLRLRPNRIIMGELRGAEAYSYLSVINSGHPGSLTTVHADSPTFAIERMALMVLQAKVGLSRSEVMEYLRLTVPIIVQFTKSPTGERYISQVYYDRVKESSTAARQKIGLVA
jgi:type IV secretion system protein VirB11